VSVLPPYHPDYEDPGVDAYPQRPYSPDSDLEYSEEGYSGSVRVRRGSEGYEVRPVSREEMFQEYVQSQINEAGRYQMYEPERALEGDEDLEDAFEEDDDELSEEVGDTGASSDDDVPLGLKR